MKHGDRRSQPTAGAACTAQAIGAIGQAVLYELRDFGVHPMIFGASEGFVIQNGIAFGSTGVVKIGVSLEWEEVPAY